MTSTGVAKGPKSKREEHKKGPEEWHNGAREETIYIDALVNLINGGSWQKAKKEAVGYRGLAVSRYLWATKNYCM